MSPEPGIDKVFDSTRRMLREEIAALATIFKHPIFATIDRSKPTALLSQRTVLVRQENMAHEYAARFHGGTLAGVEKADAFYAFDYADVRHIDYIFANYDEIRRSITGCPQIEPRMVLLSDIAEELAHSLSLHTMKPIQEVASTSTLIAPFGSRSGLVAQLNAVSAPMFINPFSLESTEIASRGFISVYRDRVSKVSSENKTTRTLEEARIAILRTLIKMVALVYEKNPRASDREAIYTGMQQIAISALKAPGLLFKEGVALSFLYSFLLEICRTDSARYIIILQKLVVAMVTLSFDDFMVRLRQIDTRAPNAFMEMSIKIGDFLL